MRSATDAPEPMTDCRTVVSVVSRERTSPVRVVSKRAGLRRSGWEHAAEAEVDHLPDGQGQTQSGRRGQDQGREGGQEPPPVGREKRSQPRQRANVTALVPLRSRVGGHPAGGISSFAHEFP